MNRKQRRAAQHGKKPKGIDLNDQEQAQKLLENLPTAILVEGINKSLDVLHKRNIPIMDWDKKSRELYLLKVYGNKVYFLAAELDRVEPIK